MRRYGLFISVALLFAFAAGHDAFDRWVDKTELPAIAAETSAEVRDRHGQLLRAYTTRDGIWRLGASPNQVDPEFIKLLIAYEDKRFWSHQGVDTLAMARAFGQAVWNGRAVSGGSTLTMQVARLLENSGTGRWQGKLRQIRLALALERLLSKDRILELYLTHAPYGGNLEGIRAATLAWYQKEPARLTTAQAAFLIALPQSPETRRPDRNPEAAVAARDRVLARLLKQAYIGIDAIAGAGTEAVPARKAAFPKLTAHLSDRVTRSAPERTRHHLTIDGSLQGKLEALATHTMSSKQAQLSIAILVANHQSGEILASVGSAGYSNNDHREGFVDMTQAVRSPGSTLKPLVYAMGFDDGLVHPETMIDDRPVRFGTYAPQNFDGVFRGELRVAEALRLSLNIPVVLLADQIGPARIMAAMRKSGAQPRLPSGKAGLAMTLGGIGITLEDLVQLYAMQARGGVPVELFSQIEAKPQPQPRVLSRSAAWQIGHILGGMPPPAGMPRNRLAYKTGTSYGHRDAWAVGYDGTHVIGVWLGRPDGTPVPGAFGGDIAAPVLFETFQLLKPRLDPLGPPPPETLLVNTAALPKPLQRFRGRNAVFTSAADGPEVTFPPDGARLSSAREGITVKVRNGTLPYSILSNGRLAVTGVHHREVVLPDPGKGASTFTIIDASGKSDRISVWID